MTEKLQPWIPSVDDPWDRTAAAHLLRRTGFGAARDRIDAIVAQSPESYVNEQLTAKPMPNPPGPWVDTQPAASLGNAEIQQYAIWLRSLQEWWLAQMLDDSIGLREKMTLFWHNHFPSEFYVVYVAQYFYQQNQLQRSSAFGNIADLLRAMTTDPGMLVYLDLGLSVAGNPNENYARELLELFMLGEGFYDDGTPHYTESDIIELARALTGWTVTGLTSTFRSTRYDSGVKTLFGESARFGLGEIGEKDVIDHILAQVDKDHGVSRAAIFLCSKLYAWFVATQPDWEVIEGMAETLVANDWEIAPVLRQLLLSRHFFSQDVRGAMIKSPADFVVGAMKELELTTDLTYLGVNAARTETHDPVTAMSQLAMAIFAPPNVKGWPGGRTWISSVTAPQRIRYVETWISPFSGAREYGFDPEAYLDGLEGRDDVHLVLDAMLAHLLPIVVDETVRAQILEILLGGAPDYEWDPDHPSTTQRLRSTLIEITRLAEYQLM